MAFKTSTKCSICRSPHRTEIEQIYTKEQKTYVETAQEIEKRHHVKISPAAIHRHMRRHYDYMAPALNEARIQSMTVFKENLMDATTRAVKISAMLEASYQKIQAEWKDLDLPTAVKVFFSATDAINKMEGIGVLDQTDFMTKFLEVLHEVKKPQQVQEVLTFESDEQGIAKKIESEPQLATNIK